MRSVEKQPLSIALATGMDEETDPRGAQPGVLYAARNCRIRTTGSLQKRCGTKGLDGTTNVPQSTEHCFVDGGGAARPAEHPAFVGMIGDQFVAGTTAGDMFSNDGDGANWGFAGCFSSVLPIKSYAMTGGGNAFDDVRYAANVSVGSTSAGYVIGAYVADNDTVRMNVRDPAGRIIYQSTVSGISTYQISRVVVVGSTAYVMWVTNGGNLTARALTISVLGVVSVSADTVIASTGSALDTSSFDGSNWFLFRSSGVGTWRLSKMSGFTEASGTDVAVAGLAFGSVWADPVYNKVWLGIVADYGVTTVTQFAIYDTTPAVVVSPTEIDATFFSGAAAGNLTVPLFGPCYSGVTPQSAMCVLSITVTSGAATVRELCAFLISETGVISTSPATFSRVPNMIPMSKPDALQRVWCRVSSGTSPVNGNSVISYMLLRFADAGRNVGANGVALIEASTGDFPNPGLGYGGISGTATPWLFHEVPSVDGRMIVGLPVTRNTETNETGGTNATTQAILYEYATSSREPSRRRIDVPSGIAIPGQPTEATTSGELDHSAATGGIEIGFGHAPAFTTSNSPTPSATGVGPGTYAYVAVMEWFDSSGRVHRSAPSSPKEVTIDVTSTVLLGVAYPRIGQRPLAYGTGTGPRIIIYRTTNGGENYQQLSIEGSFVTAGLVTFSDANPDEVVAENAFVYTDGGVLPNVLAPTCRFMCSAEDRIWCGGLWNPEVIEASKVIVPEEAPAFTGDASHQVVLPDDCTGLAYMDGQVVAFSESAIYLVGGDGPNDQGAGAFLPPRLLTRGVGCINYLSVLETAIGVIFQSAQGIYLLPRGFGAPQYIGVKAQDTLLANPTILSAVATNSSEYRLARFLIAPEGETESETILTFDIDTGNWFVDTYQADDGTYGSFSILGEGPDGCAMVRNTLTSAATPVWYEDETRFYDEFALVGDGFVGRYIETAWMAPFGPAGWGRVNKCMVVMSKEYGGSTSADKVVIELEVDTDLSTEALSWSVPAAGESLSYRGFDITRRDCTMVRGIITETSTGVAAEIQSRGPKFLSLSFEVESQGGMRMLTDSERS